MKIKKTPLCGHFAAEGSSLFIFRIVCCLILIDIDQMILGILHNLVDSLPGQRQVVRNQDQA